MNPKVARIHVSVPRAIEKKLRDEADREHRTVSQQIQFILSRRYVLLRAREE